MSKPSPIDVEARGVSMTFRTGDRRVSVLENVSLTVERGSFFSIVGPSGCGKSTLLRILLGFERPTEGSVFVDPRRRSEGLAYVQQSAALLPWRTVLQNAVLGVEVKRKLSDVVVARVINRLQEFGLSGFENSLDRNLSGGMRQRVALIRALESLPGLLFCDEPFSAIDFVTRLELNTIFKKMCRIEGMTTIFVTHNIEEAIFLSDQLVVMSGRPGKIVGRYHPKLGEPDAVKARNLPEFAQLFKDIWLRLRDYRFVGGGGVSYEDDP